MLCVNERVILVHYLQNCAEELRQAFRKNNLKIRIFNDPDVIYKMEVEELKKVADNFYYTLKAFKTAFPSPDEFLQNIQNSLLDRDGGND
jgi:hypothetical protein